MLPLSEDKIKQAAIRFLKTYYKFRPRTSKTEARIDMHTADGIIADGMLLFDDEEEQAFMATVECTSSESRGEVMYRLQKRVLIWDSLAFGSIAAAFLFSYGYAYNHFTVEQIGLAGSLAVLISFLVLTFSIYYFLFRSRHKYRYIYAIEQFKRYHADEQWIALAKDVFFPDSPAEEASNIKPKELHFLDELKAQCISNGFGLIEVDHQLDARPLITPARVETFGSKRNMLQFFGDSGNPTDAPTERLRSLWDKTGIHTALQTDAAKSLLRYQKSHFHQMVMVALAITIIGIIYYKEMQNAQIVYVDQEQHLKQMNELKAHPGRESELLVVDTPYLARQVESMQKYPKEEQEEALLDTRDVSDADADLLGILPQYDDRTQIFVHNNPLEGTAYDCERFYNIRQTVFVVQDSKHESIETARQRLLELRRKSISASILWLGCFSKSKLYIVYFDQMYTHRSEAKTLASRFAQLLKEKRAGRSDLHIRSISRVH